MSLTVFIRILLSLDESGWLCLHTMGFPVFIYMGCIYLNVMQTRLIMCFYIRWVCVSLFTSDDWCLFPLDEFTWVCLHHRGLRVFFFFSFLVLH